MALSNTNISVSLVRDTIGESVNSVGALVTSVKVNPWGFNSPDAQQQLKYFGNLNRLEPHQLGSFRGYDHYWRCYCMGEPTISPLLANYESGNIVINLQPLPTVSYGTVGVQHLFDVYFSRINDFSHLEFAQILSNAVINDNETLFIPLNPFAPPDGGAVLAENSSVYFKIKHVSSPARRWDKRQIGFDPLVITRDTEDDAYIIKVDIGEDIFTYHTSMIRTENTTPIVYKNANGGMWAYVTLRNGNKHSVRVELSFQVNDASDFTGSRNETAFQEFIIPAATRSGSELILGTIDVVIYGPASFSQWTLGQAFYGRVKINTCSDGTFSGGYQGGFNGNVGNLPPLD